MSSGELGGEDDARDRSIAEGLEGLKTEIVDGNLRVEDMATCFRSGRGSRKEPLEPMAPMHLRDTLENAMDIASLVEEYDLKRTMFFSFNGMLLGVDSRKNVQLVQDPKWDIKDRKYWVSVVLGALAQLRKNNRDPENWAFRVVE